jgi:hypothetical protein
MIVLASALAPVSAALSSMQAAPVPVQKLGVYDYMTEESTPFIWHGALLMLESIPKAYAGYAPEFDHCASYLRVRDMRTLSVVVNITASCGLAFGAAVVATGADSGRDVLLVSATTWDRSVSPWAGPCAGSAPSNCSVLLLSSSSAALEDASWSVAGAVRTPFGVYNTDISAVPAAAGAPYAWVMALETTAETARFLGSASADPRQAASWALLDGSHTVPRLPDVGSCPSLRHDGQHYYYLTGGTNINILRSADLATWSGASSRVIEHGAAGDCIVAPAFFGPYVPTGEALAHLQACGAAGNFGDDSDVDLVEWPAPFGSSSGGPAVLIEYGSGDQRTFGFSNLALANGTLNAFLQSFFA